MVTLDCPACGTQIHIASESIVETGRHRAQYLSTPASAQSYYAPPIYHTATCRVHCQNISFMESTRSMLMLLFLLACLFTIAVALVMDFEDIEVPDTDANKTPALPSGTETMIVTNKWNMLFNAEYCICDYCNNGYAEEHGKLQSIVVNIVKSKRQQQR